MQKWVFSLILCSALGAGFSTSVVASEVEARCTTGSTCNYYYDYPTSESDCNAKGASECYSQAADACDGHGGLSSYNCGSCVRLDPGYGACPASTGWFVQGTYQCND